MVRMRRKDCIPIPFYCNQAKMKASHLFSVFAVILSFLFKDSSIRAQDVMVMCSEPGSANCSNSADNIPLLAVTYASCCTTVNAENRYYVDPSDGTDECRRCGPILDEKMTLPTSSLANTVIFSWKLAPLSVIPVSEFVVGSKMENELVFFPNPVPATNFSIVFMQTEGVRFIYRIRARAATGGLSPAIDMAWVTGDSLAPLLGDFIVVSINNQEVTIEWVLDFNGVCPVENIVFTLSLPLTDEEVDNRTMLFDQPQPDDTRFTTTFTIQGVQQYVLQVNASNGKHSTTVFYVVDAVSPEPLTPLPPGGIRNAARLSCLHGLYLFLLPVMHLVVRYAAQ